ncbi:heme ABC transporter ATP-binding protein [Marinimicrobium agarilyticum]|uniref:heme ABC transporter ATP-binding protein n=1 Tax=Marinimicrobium agarilyticum TaxID=306546 RepID=UPI0003F57EE9|nr:heme ABC transporter ATP-binding protein [Marinimicrobium agarilyticum]
MPLLQIDHLSLQIEQRELVRDVSLAVEPGEILSIIGPNGAGKTTLLRSISADLEPAAGQLQFNGRPLSDWRAAERALAMAVLTQANPLSFPFTVGEVVALGRTPHSTGLAVDREVCRAAMKALDVNLLESRLYPSLSGGEKQRVQLARVMAQIWRPDTGADRLLLLDEPVTSLDLGHQRQLMQAIRQFADSGVGVVMVVHDISLAAAYSDHLLALNNGQRVAYGTPEEVVTSALMSELFNTEVDVIPHPQSGKPVVLAR